MAPIEELLADGARHRREGRPDEALPAYQAAAGQARSRGAPAALVDALCGLGQVERDRGQSDAAAGHYEEALLHCRPQGQGLRLAHVSRHLGDLYRESGRYAASRPILEEALGLYRRSPGATDLDLANTLRPLALLREGLGDKAGANQLWRQARDLYAASGADDGVQECDARMRSTEPP